MKNKIGDLYSLSGYVFGYQNKAAFKKRLESKAKRGILLTQCGFDMSFDTFMSKSDSNAQKRYAVSVINYLTDWSDDKVVNSIGKTFKNKYSQCWSQNN
jgi:hypothetical protein